MKQRKVCPRGHVFYKSSDCPTCPECEAARKLKNGFLTLLAAPARRALEGAGLTTLAKVARCSEAEIRELHGMGPNAIGKLRAALKKDGMSFRKE
jgi:hypothetical protein